MAVDLLQILDERGDALALNNLTLDSRAVTRGDGFVALPGTGSQHGLDFLSQALANGAAAVVVECGDLRVTEAIEAQLTIAKVPLVKIEDLKNRLGEIASAFYAHPSQQLKVIGVTGTDGKTSVTQFIARLLEAQGEQCGVIGTLGSMLANTTAETLNTTPDVINIHRLLAQFVAAGARYAAMEVSSHALSQGRVDAVQFDVAVFTNLGRDHLDYHGTVEAYGQAKARLFQRPGLTAAVVNADDAYCAELIRTHSAAQLVTYGHAAAKGSARHYQISRDHVDDSGLKFQLENGDEKAHLSVSLIGQFNIANLSASIAALGALGWTLPALMPAISSLQPVPGRAERFYAALDEAPTVVVDYAHTPQSLGAILASVREHCQGQLICVFGCGGDRDRGKRAEMASMAEHGADVVIVTDDNPRSESPQAIVEDIKTGFSERASYRIVHDRAAAIQCAIQLGEGRDWVVVAGKGHETQQWIAGVANHFSDREVVQSLLNNEDEKCA